METVNNILYEHLALYGSSFLNYFLCLFILCLH